MNQPWWQRILFLPPQASSIASDIDTLHVAILSLTLVCSILIFAFIGFCIYASHKRERRRLQAPRWGKSAEVLPGALLLVLFFLLFAFGYRQYAALRVAVADPVEITVTAKQWMWTFTAPDGASSINDITLEVGKPVRLTMYSRDVIHSFFVPAFRLKQDVLPGRATTLTFTPTVAGTYPILCAEYCGLQHAAMRGSITVVSKTLSTAKPRKTSALAQRGAHTFQQHGCNACHSTDGTQYAGPTLLDVWGAPRVLRDGSTIAVDAGYISDSITDPRAHLVDGYAPIMPSYAGVIEPAQIAEIIAYLRELRREDRL